MQNGGAPESVDVIFIKFDQTIHKVDLKGTKLNVLSDLVPIITDKFPDKDLGPLPDLYITDNGVRSKLLTIVELKNGCVLELVLPNSAPNGKRKLEDGGEGGSDPKKPKTETSRFIVRLRGLPWEANDQVVRNFFKDIPIKEAKIKYLPNGRSTGEAIVEFNDVAGHAAGLNLSGSTIGARYIEVFQSSPTELDMVAGRIVKPTFGFTPKPRKDPDGQRYIVRLRGIPWQAKQNEIAVFFSGIDIVEIVIKRLPNGRSMGEGMVELCDSESFKQALQKTGESMGNRYIEVFESDVNELDLAAGRKQYKCPMDPNSHVTRCRGLPYSAQFLQVAAFFGQNPSGPLAVHLTREPMTGRPSGVCYIEWETAEEAKHSLLKNKQYFPNSSRYVETFPSNMNEMIAVVTGQDVHFSQGGIMHRGQGNYEVEVQPTSLPPGSTTIIRMMGLPNGCTEIDITAFFQAVNVIPARIHRNTGEAYVEFMTAEACDLAMGRNKCYIGAKFVELYRVSAEELISKVGPQAAPINMAFGGTGWGQGAMMAAAGMFGGSPYTHAYGAMGW